MLDHNADGLESVCDNRTLWRPDDITFLAKNDGNKAYNHHAETHQVGRPESNIAFHVGCRDKGKRAQVDTAVKDKIDPLNCDSGVNDDALAGFGNGLDGHFLPSVLICDQGGNIGFDTTGPNADDQNCSDKTSHAGAICKRSGKSCNPEDEQSGHIDTAKPYNCPIFAEILVCDDGTEDGSHFSELATASSRWKFSVLP